MYLIAIILLGIPSSFAVIHTFDSCPIKLEPVGCYDDKPDDRALPVEFLNARQSDRHIYAGYMMDWDNWDTYLQRFICDCAMKAYQKNYKVMGVQFYGECWGSLNGHKTYAKHGESKSCVNRHKNPMRRCTNSDRTCTGELSTNFVYKIAPTDCDVNYEPVGCFADKQNAPRPLPDYIMNERDYKASNWNKMLIDWKNWNTYSPQMICRCAAEAKKLGKTIFSVQFYGECWSGETAKINYKKDGPSQECLAKDFLPCPYNSYDCVGKAFANSVFRLKAAPNSTYKRTIRRNPNLIKEYQLD